MRNGEHVKDTVLDSTVLNDGDEVLFVPPLKGG
jgi:molybdopterin converting factor small subunit